MMEKTNVLIADNQPYTRIGITAVLSGYMDHQLVIDHADDKEALYEKLKLNPKVLIIDFEMFEFNPIAELAEIRNISPCIGILVITDNYIIDDVLKVIDCGITNYILKSCNEQELIEAFNATIARRKYFSGQVLDVLLERKSSSRNAKVPNGHITPSEKEIIKLITQGLSTKDIAAQKKLSYHTIIAHRKNIFRKLNITNTTELVVYAMRTNIIDSTEYYI